MANVKGHLHGLLDWPLLNKEDNNEFKILTIWQCKKHQDIKAKSQFDDQICSVWTVLTEIYTVDLIKKNVLLLKPLKESTMTVRPGNWQKCEQLCHRISQS